MTAGRDCDRRRTAPATAGSRCPSAEGFATLAPANPLRTSTIRNFSPGRTMRPTASGRASGCCELRLVHHNNRVGVWRLDVRGQRKGKGQRAKGKGQERADVRRESGRRVQQTFEVGVTSVRRVFPRRASVCRDRCPGSRSRLRFDAGLKACTTTGSKVLRTLEPWNLWNPWNNDQHRPLTSPLRTVHAHPQDGGPR